MSPWKVILATMIIFACGVITGGLLTRNLEAPAHLAAVPQAAVSTNAPKAAKAPNFGVQRPEFLRSMDRQLDLTPQQHDDIARIIKSSHERTQALWDQIAPQMTEELKRVREEIRLVLTPEQRKRWGELMKHRKPEPPPEKENTQTNTSL